MVHICHTQSQHSVVGHHSTDFSGHSNPVALKKMERLPNLPWDLVGSQKPTSASVLWGIVEVPFCTKESTSCKIRTLCRTKNVGMGPPFLWPFVRRNAAPFVLKKGVRHQDAEREKEAMGIWVIGFFSIRTFRHSEIIDQPYSAIISQLGIPISFLLKKHLRCNPDFDKLMLLP